MTLEQIHSIIPGRKTNKGADEHLQSLYIGYDRSWKSFGAKVQCLAPVVGVHDGMHSEVHGDEVYSGACWLHRVG